ncbi:MAG: TPM domain-containing protein [Vampirovibrionales bacterium]|nr:TPM domain-containing protein [Vampirovibrionales bacterium]
MRPVLNSLKRPFGFVVLALLSLWVISGLAQVCAATQVNAVPPAPRGPSFYVTDRADLITPDDETLLVATLRALEQDGHAQIAILTLPDTSRELSEFSVEIFNAWGIGHKAKNNGVLILANASRIRNKLSGNRIYVTTGLGAEALLPDALAGRILDVEALPAFAQRQYSLGLKNTALSVAKIMAGDTQLRQSYAVQTQQEAPEVNIIMLLLMLLIFAWLISKSGGGPFIMGGGGFGSYGGGGGFGGGSSGGGGAGR